MALLTDEELNKAPAGLTTCGGFILALSGAYRSPAFTAAAASA